LLLWINHVITDSDSSPSFEQPEFKNKKWSLTKKNIECDSMMWYSQIILNAQLQFHAKIVGENMSGRLTDQHKSPRNLPRKSTANGSAGLNARIGPKMSSKKGTLHKRVGSSGYAFRSVAARMESGTTDESRPWPGQVSLMLERVKSVSAESVFRRVSPRQGVRRRGGRIGLGRHLSISPYSLPDSVWAAHAWYVLTEA